MKGACRYLLLAAAIIGFSACSVTKYRPYSVDGTRLNFSMDDLEYLGETEISVDYRRYIGFIHVVDSINGKVNDRVVTRRVDFGNVPDGLYPYLNRAAYKLMEEFPDADYYMLVAQNKSVVRLFLGSDIEVTARIKAYKFR
ncbi:MAG TPA: hypothetical protein IAC03_00590 [Candidatus Coprenecus pullistercoris]|nr:hypothetical protein [Candidatus Coprenecus pullistercoris]